MEVCLVKISQHFPTLCFPVLRNTKSAGLKIFWHFWYAKHVYYAYLWVNHPQILWVFNCSKIRDKVGQFFSQMLKMSTLYSQIIKVIWKDFFRNIFYTVKHEIFGAVKFCSFSILTFSLEEIVVHFWHRVGEGGLGEGNKFMWWWICRFLVNCEIRKRFPPCENSYFIIFGFSVRCFVIQDAPSPVNSTFTTLTVWKSNVYTFWSHLIKTEY